YRWVHLRDVVRQKPEEPQPALSAADSKDQETALTPALSQREREQEHSLRVDRGVEPAQFKSKTSGGDTKATSPDGFVPRKRREAEQNPSAALDPGARVAAATPRAAPTTSGSGNYAKSGLRGDEIARQLDEIE